VSEIPTSDDVRAAWDENARYWDERLVRPESWQHVIVFPAVEALLGLVPGERVLELACGNGLLAQRMGQAGADVLATDLSQGQLRSAAEHVSHPNVRLAEVDISDRVALDALGGDFDAVVCCMGLMDVSDIEPLAAALPRLLRPDGRFVFAVTHPSFNNMSLVRVTERRVRGKALVDELAVRVSRYTTAEIGRGVGMDGQPAPIWYFDRPLDGLLRPFFAAGLVMDGLTEPVFDAGTAERIGADPVWTEIPPILAGRLRRP
jgi:2-polyprenyl-3-methyl-5-hydroxy-6-metoxy-1,4-benzoquinol methylase